LIVKTKKHSLKFHELVGVDLEEETSEEVEKVKTCGVPTNFFNPLWICFFKVLAIYDSHSNHQRNY